MLGQREEYIRMANVELHHWWYQTLHQKVLDAIRTYAISSDPHILDAGCGTGGMITRLRENGYSKIQGFDLSQDAVGICRKKNILIDQENICNVGQHYPPTSVDVIISNDTLYFFSKHEYMRIIEQFEKTLRSGGLLIVNIPSLNAFSGIHDIAVGINSRFTKKDLAFMFPKEEWGISEVSYWPFLLSPIIYLSRFWQRITLKTNKKSEARSDIDLPINWINQLLLMVMHFERRFISFSPFGSSLFIVVQKKS